LSRDFAVLVLVGRKLKMFHLRPSRPNIPPRTQIPTIETTIAPKKENMSANPLTAKDTKYWRAVGIDINNLRKQIEWQEVDQMLECAKDEEDDVHPFDAMKQDDQPYIDGTVRWLVQLANTYGLMENEYLQ
jgi:hypothetical protein